MPGSLARQRRRQNPRNKPFAYGEEIGARQAFPLWCSATYLKQRVCFCAGERAQSPLSPRSRLRAYEGQTEDPSNVSVSFV